MSATSPPAPTPRSLRPRRRIAGRDPGAPFAVGERSAVRRDGDITARTALLMLVGLVALAAAVRFAVPRGLWLDEAISVNQARLSPGALVQQLAQGDRHPPLHHLILWGTTRLLGEGDLAVRVPSIIAGIMLVPVVYALAAELHDRRTGVVAALFATLAPVLVWYSQEARGYELVSLFGAALVLAAVRALRRGGWTDWLGVAVAGALGLWTHWFFGLLLAAIYGLLLAALVGRLRARRPVRDDVVRLAVATLVLATQLVPLAMLAAAQIQSTGTGGGFAGADGGGGGLSLYGVMANASWAVWGFHAQRVTDLGSAIWPLLMLGTLLALGRGLSRPTAVLMWCALAPVVALGVLAAFNPQLFEIRYAMAVVPLVMVLLARIAVGAARNAAARRLLVGAIALSLAVGLADQQLNPANARRYDNREALGAVRAQLRPGDVVLYEPAELRYVLDRYAPDLPARPLEGTLPRRREARRVFVLASFLDQDRYRGVVDRQLGALRYARQAPVRRHFSGVDVWRFG